MRNHSSTTNAEYWYAILTIVASFAIIIGCNDLLRKPLPHYQPPGARR